MPSPDLVRSRRMMDFNIQDQNRFSVRERTGDPISFHDPYPRTGPCYAGCGREIWKKSGTHKCVTCGGSGVPK